LAALLRRDAAGVVALGGGTWILPANRKLLVEHRAITIWLDASFELCWNRIEASRQRRPLAPSEDAARKRYLERVEVYKLAEHRIGVDASETADEIATRIASILRDDAKNQRNFSYQDI
jgi:shikimate kinase